MKNVIKWLQLSDIHIFTSSKWNLMKDSYYKKLKQEDISFIIIVGDLHQFGEKYKESLDFLNELSCELSVEKKYIYILPGNHDKDKISEDSISDAVTSICVKTEDNADFYCKRKEILRKVYKDYERFLDDFYGEEAKPFIRIIDGLEVFSVENKLNLILINSTFVSDGSHEHKEIIPIWELTKLRIENGNPSIICMHYHPGDLFKSHEEILNSVVKNLSVAALICGHRHRSDYTNNKENYSNSFACPIVVGPKGAFEKKDHYSDIGYIIHNWDVKQNKVSCKYYHWIEAYNGGRFSYDQRFQNDDEEFPSYSMIKRSKIFDADGFCRKIVDGYKKFEEGGFTYIEINWKSDEMDDIQSCRVEEILNSDNKYVRFLGEAGCGKTTALLRLQYLSACRYLEGTSKKIPVLISLINFEKDANAIPDLTYTIKNCLKIEEDICLEMLKKNDMTLYLDGYNEIHDNKKKKQFAWSVEEFQKEYPDVQIFITDRSITKNFVPILEMAMNYHLFPLTIEMKKNFVIGNCPNEDARAILLTAFLERPDYFDEFDTPIRMKHLILLTALKKKLSEDPSGDYIEYLFNREHTEKKDENMVYLHRFAQALALINENDFSVLMAEKCLAQCKNLLGYTIPDTRNCLNLLIDMGILLCENNKISFAQEEYRSYFWTEAITDGLDEILNLRKKC